MNFPRISKNNNENKRQQLNLITVFGVHSGLFLSYIIFFSYIIFILQFSFHSNV